MYFMNISFKMEDMDIDHPSLSHQLNEIIQHIGYFLPQSDISSLSQTSHHMNYLFSEDIYYKEKMMIEFPGFPILSSSWKTSYIIASWTAKEVPIVFASQNIINRIWNQSQYLNRDIYDYVLEVYPISDRKELIIIDDPSSDKENNAILIYSDGNKNRYLHISMNGNMLIIYFEDENYDIAPFTGLQPLHYFDSLADFLTTGEDEGEEEMEILKPSFTFTFNPKDSIRTFVGLYTTPDFLRYNLYVVHPIFNLITYTLFISILEHNLDTDFYTYFYIDSDLTFQTLPPPGHIESIRLLYPSHPLLTAYHIDHNLDI